jgi:hypothetical protein
MEGHEAEMSAFSKTWAILRTRKKFWLPPIVLMLIIVGAFIVIAKAAVLAPLIYAFF